MSEQVLTKSELNVILLVREAKNKLHSRIEIEIKDGKIVKFWTTEKKDINELN